MLKLGISLVLILPQQHILETYFLYYYPYNNFPFSIYKLYKRNKIETQIASETIKFNISVKKVRTNRPTITIIIQIQPFFWFFASYILNLKAVKQTITTFLKLESCEGILVITFLLSV